MTGLDVDVSKFWIYLLFIFTTTFCVTALYRMFASLSPTIDDAVRFSGLALNLLMWVISAKHVDLFVANIWQYLHWIRYSQTSIN